MVSLVVPRAVPRVVANDADDDHVIAAAVTAHAELIVTGDRKHLLPISSHQGIRPELHQAVRAIERRSPSALQHGKRLRATAVATGIAEAPT